MSNLAGQEVEIHVAKGSSLAFGTQVKGERSGGCCIVHLVVNSFDGNEWAIAHTCNGQCCGTAVVVQLVNIRLVVFPTSRV